MLFWKIVFYGYCLMYVGGSLVFIRKMDNNLKVTFTKSLWDLIWTSTFLALAVIGAIKIF